MQVSKSTKSQPAKKNRDAVSVDCVFASLALPLTTMPQSFRGASRVPAAPETPTCWGATTTGWKTSLTTTTLTELRLSDLRLPSGFGDCQRRRTSPRKRSECLGSSSYLERHPTCLLKYNNRKKSEFRRDPGGSGT